MAVNKRLELDNFSGPFELREASMPQAPTSGAVVKLHYTGICHSDVHLWEGNFDIGGGQKVRFGDAPAAKVLGHEMSGEIHSLGADAKKDGKLAVGDRVIVFPWPGCGECGLCKVGENVICPKQSVTALGCLAVDGGYQTYVSVPQVSLLHPVPKGLSMNLGAIMTCSGITAYNAVSSVKAFIEKFVKANGSATLLIAGAGGVGLWGIEIAKAIMPKGTTIAVAEISDTKFPAAREAGADKTVLWNPKAAPEENAAKTKEELGGVHAAVDFVGAASTSQAILSCLVPGSKMTLVGLFGGALCVPIPVMAVQTQTISGSYVGSQRHLTELAELAAQGKIKGPPMANVTLNDVSDVIADLKQGKRTGRSVVSHLH